MFTDKSLTERITLMNSKLSSRFKKFENSNNEIIQNEKPFEPEIKSSVEIINPKIDLKQMLLDKIDSTPVWFEYTPEQQRNLIKNFIEKHCPENANNENLYNEIISIGCGFGPIQNLIEDEQISNISIRKNKKIIITSKKQNIETEIKLSEKQFTFVTNTIAQKSGINQFKTVQEVLIDNLSIIIVNPPVCESSIYIKKIQTSKQNLSNIIPKKYYDFILSEIIEGKNIIISGNKKSGKTTLFNSLIKDCKIQSYAFTTKAPIIPNENLTVFNIKNNTENYKTLIEHCSENPSNPIFLDYNNFEKNISNKYIQTINEATSENAFKHIIANFAKDISEKSAKVKALTEIDYIILLDNSSKPALTEIVELSPQKTMTQSFKTILKLENNDYVDLENISIVE